MPPSPELTARGEEAVFYARLAEEELTFQSCLRCSAAIWYLRTVCPTCMSPDLQLQTSNGLGTVYSFTTLYRAGHPSRSAEVPYSVGLVDLDEGVRVLGDLTELTDGEGPIGLRVRAGFRHVSDELTLLTFAPTGDQR